MNEHFGQPLVISHRGGKGGGNAVVTEHGLKIIDHFHQLQQKLQEFLATNSINLTL
jgi:molybdate transport system regulatory protein